MNYFLQNVIIEKTSLSRRNFISKYVENKTVLHVGFVDWPITKEKKENLHLSIAPICRWLDGIDTNLTPEMEQLLSISNGNIYTSWDQIKNIYDTIIIPEVIEHVGNLENFLNIFNNFSAQIIITAPDAYLLKNNFQETPEGFFEHIHPDHNYWFSPYTLKNVIEKYMKNKKLVKMYWIKGSVAAIIE